MTNSRTCSESGFTLVELLLVTAIIGILTGLSVQAYSIHREKAYHSMALQMMGQTRTAMQAGKIDSEKFTENLFFISSASGPATTMDGEEIVPGLVLPENFYLYVFHNPSCSVTGCVEDYVISRHCKVKKRVVYWKSHKIGESIVYDSVDASDC